jgi:transcriptional regulator with XRE-family HTH domain
MKKFLEELEKVGWTQAEIAERAGVTAATINRYKLGKIEPSIKVVIKLADEFGVSLDAVMGREKAVVQKNSKKRWERKKASCKTAIPIT